MSYLHSTIYGLKLSFNFQLLPRLPDNMLPWLDLPVLSAHSFKFTFKIIKGWALYNTASLINLLLLVVLTVHFYKRFELLLRCKYTSRLRHAMVDETAVLISFSRLSLLELSDTSLHLRTLERFDRLLVFDRSRLVCQYWLLKLDFGLKPWLAIEVLVAMVRAWLWLLKRQFSEVFALNLTLNMGWLLLLVLQAGLLLIVPLMMLKLTSALVVAGEVLLAIILEHLINDHAARLEVSSDLFWLKRGLFSVRGQGIVSGTCLALQLLWVAATSGSNELGKPLSLCAAFLVIRLFTRIR